MTSNFCLNEWRLFLERSVGIYCKYHLIFMIHNTMCSHSDTTPYSNVWLQIVRFMWNLIVSAFNISKSPLSSLGAWLFPVKTVSLPFGTVKRTYAWYNRKKINAACWENGYLLYAEHDSVYPKGFPKHALIIDYQCQRGLHVYASRSVQLIWTVHSCWYAFRLYRVLSSSNDT